MDDFLLLDELYSEEAKIARDSVRQMVQSVVLPKIAQSYEEGVFPKSFIEQSANLGLFGMTLPQEYGGSEASYVSYGLVCQELEAGDSGLRSFVSVQSSLCMYPIYTFGNEAQRLKYLPKMAKGEWIGCFGLTEPNAGSDPGSMQTTAKKVDGGWILNGSKTWITNATIADLAIVWAKNEQGQVRGFVVEKGTKGFTVEPIKHKGSLRASITGMLFFDECFVPEDALLPGSEKGLAAPLSCLTQARYGIAWGAMGAAMACYQAALDYTKERIQFKQPIAANQLVQKDLVDMFSEIVKAQTLNLRIGTLKDMGKSNYAMVSLAKRNACYEALKIARKARNLLGANGISLEYPVIRHMMNLEAVYTYEGTHNMHTLILGREITKISAFE